MSGCSSFAFGQGWWTDAPVRQPRLLRDGGAPKLTQDVDYGFDLSQEDDDTEDSAADDD